MKKAISLFLALMLLLALGVPALAEDGYAPFQLHSHYWKAYVNGYIGLYTCAPTRSSRRSRPRAGSSGSR